MRVASDERAVELAIEDDGRGAADDAQPQMGWLGMRERVAALGGRLTIGPGRDGGVSIHADIPIGAQA